jgi:hypothetical protein
MNNPLDYYLQKNLRSWAAVQQPPKNARSRLLLQAASPFYKKVEAPLEEWMVERPKLIKPYLGYPHRDLPGMFESLWVTQLQLPAKLSSS